MSLQVKKFSIEVPDLESYIPTQYFITNKNFNK